ncbi:citryl-CoA lyase [Sphingomonas flavescens]|uniref:citryl-CoA lyase n=1 Tax=Sphingomonas flavescens TaxID=3132797 RepID=UPI002805499B|nr:citryl-CoA lyase [Sphingomonas limnosediminicola]
MSDTAEDIVAGAERWWSTSIIDIHPGEIDIRGYPVQDLIGAISFPQMIWLMVRGDLPTPGQARLLEAALVASVDHGPHAPSIAISRMAISCGAELNNAMASAINVLADVHGGAGQQCMEFYQIIRSHMTTGSDLESAVEAALPEYREQHGKIVGGFGHRWHPVDPRTEPLLAMVQDLADAGEITGEYIAIGRAVEAVLTRHKGKPIPMNIDGSTAVIFSELGFEPAMGRGLFILSRSVGILSHAWEQMQQGGRIKGPMPKNIPFTYTGPQRRSLESSKTASAAGRSKS